MVRIGYDVESVVSATYSEEGGCCYGKEWLG